MLGELFRDWKLTPAAAAIGVSASQFSRYLSGETILPTPYYDRVAATAGISRADLVIRLGLLDDEDEQVREAVQALHALMARDREQDRNGRALPAKRAEYAG